MSERVALTGPCRCTGGPRHPDGDWVELVSRANIAIGAAAHMAVALHGNDPILLQGALGRAYVLHGITAWSFIDEQGPVPIARDRGDWEEVVDRWLPFANGGMLVAERADELYSQDTIGPLLARSSMRSPDGRMAGPTSAIRPIGSKPPRRSSPSSRKHTAGRRSGARGR